MPGMGLTVLLNVLLIDADYSFANKGNGIYLSPGAAFQKIQYR
jgi:hypothetical protein